MATDNNVEKDFSNIYEREDIEETFLNKDKQNKYHMTNIDLTKRPITKAEIVEELSKIHRDIKPEQIKRLLDSYERLAQKEVITNGYFRINGLVTIEPKLWNINGNEVEKVPNVEKEVWINPPTTVRLKAVINPKLKEDFRWARRYEETLTLGIPLEDWYKPFELDEIPEKFVKAKENHKKYLENRYNKNK